MTRELAFIVLSLAAATSGWGLGANVVTADDACNLLWTTVIDYTWDAGYASPEAALLAIRDEREYPTEAAMEAALEAAADAPDRISTDLQRGYFDFFHEGRFTRRARFDQRENDLWLVGGFAECL